MKKAILICLFFFPFLNGYTQTPVLDYPFNGNANDISGNNQNGTVVNATLTTDRFGANNSAYYFNGTNASIGIPYSSLINIPSSGKFTITLWIQPETANQISALFVKSPYHADYYSSNWDYGIYLVSNKPMSGYANSNHLQSSTVLTHNACWYHVAVVYDNGSWDLYINGKLDVTNHSQTKFILQSTGALAMGKKGEANGDYFKGKIDDVKFYNQALTATQIKNQITSYFTFANNDTIITQGQSTQLNATGGTSYSWTPTTGLSNPNIANPIASPATTTTYIVTATNGGCSMKDTVVVTVLPQVNCSYNDLINTPNIVTNGDFEAGNTGFSSALPYYSSGGLMPEGQYTILNNATSVNGAWSGTDHTSGSGKFFVANGGNSVMDVWCQTVNVEPNTYYRFAAWFNNIINPAIYSGPFPKMELRINGQTISKNITIPETPEEWILLDTLWFSGGNTTAQLCIRNATVGGAGNDFGIDDISFKKCSASQTTCFSCATPDPLNAGLITCYPFSGNANDESGNGNHGTNNGATFTTDRFNAANKAAMFNGSSSYITISNSASLQSPTTEFTASLWVYITAWYIDAGNWASAFCKSNSASATQYRISMMPNGASFIFNGKMVNVPISSGTIQLNQWYHIAIAANNNIVTFYINGILQSSTTFSGTFSNDNTMPLEIGRDYAGNSVDYFNGKIDDLRLYNRALSASEVLQLYNLPQSSGGIITANAGTDQTICPKDSAQLTATGGTTYSWLPTAGLNNPNIANPKASPDTTTQYIVAVSNSSCVGYDTVVVFVDTLNPIIDTVVLMCLGDSVQLQAHGGANYKWRYHPDISDTISASPYVKPTVSSWFYVAVTTNHSCVFEDSVFVEIISSLNTISGADTTICERDSAQLSATGGTTFIWFPTMGLSNANIANPKASPATTTTYIVKGEVGNCFAYDTVTIFVKPSPTALFKIDPTTGNIPFDVTTTNLSSPLPLTYLWKNMADTGFSSTDFEPVITINQMGEHYILLEVTDAEGCTDRTRSGVIDATDDIRIFIPNVFTPNSDKINDFFEVLFSKTTIKKVSGTIWNRWGGKVYEFEMPNGKWWNGKTEDGNDCTEGVYVYIIETFDFKNKRIKTYRGTVTLLR